MYVLCTNMKNVTVTTSLSDIIISISIGEKTTNNLKHKRKRQSLPQNNAMNRKKTEELTPQKAGFNQNIHLMIRNNNTSNEKNTAPDSQEQTWTAESISQKHRWDKTTP